MAEYNEDAQHPATAVRLQQATREGDAPKSYELIAALQITTGVVILYFLFNALAATIARFASSAWQASGISLDAVGATVATGTEDLTVQLSVTLLPIMASILVCAVLSHLVQSGTAAGFRKPVWQPQQINPVSGIRRLFSLENLLRGVLGIPKVAVIGLVTLVVIWNQRFDLAGLQQVGAQELGPKLIYQVFVVLMAAAGTLLAVSTFDYFVQWYSFQNRMRMTDQQLRDENRLQSIDPQIKSRRIEFFDQISIQRRPEPTQRSSGTD